MIKMNKQIRILRDSLNSLGHFTICSITLFLSIESHFRGRFFLEILEQICNIKLINVIKSESSIIPRLSDGTSLGNILDDLLQPTSFKMSPTANSGPKLLFLILRLIKNRSHLCK